MDSTQIADALDSTFEQFRDDDIPRGVRFVSGKVRDIFSTDSRMVIVTTDRISAFDRVLTTIPYKGQVLNQTAAFWFENTADIIDNHIIDVLSPRSIQVKKCEVVPVEVIVRGYLTGSAWRDYSEGKAVSGLDLPAGMHFNQKFTEPVITPTTKAERGGHDEPVSSDALIKKGLCDKDVWERIETAALALFQRGSELVAKQGLILVDTKYEFGLLDGKLVVIDEIHTPDSSRFWFADTYQALFNRGEKQRKLDKEYLRIWLRDQGFTGTGKAPQIPDNVRVEVAARYIKAYERITGLEFDPRSIPEAGEKKLVLKALS